MHETKYHIFCEIFINFHLLKAEILLQMHKNLLFVCVALLGKQDEQW